MRSVSATEIADDEYSRILTSLVTPRPIGWISTTSETGVDNLAPFSCYSYASTSPPVIQFRCSRRNNNDLKDTPRNVLEREEFVANLVTQDQIKKMDKTAMNLSSEESEFEAVGIDQADSFAVDPPRVATAKAHLECELYDSISIYDSIVIFGDVKYFHFSEEILDDGKVDMRKIDTIGRLGGPYYTESTSIDFERQS